MVKALQREPFERIIRTGRGFGERSLGLMTLVALDRFKALSDQDIDDPYLHLASLSETRAAQDVFWRP